MLVESVVLSKFLLQAGGLAAGKVAGFSRNSYFLGLMNSLYNNVVDTEFSICFQAGSLPVYL